MFLALAILYPNDRLSGFAMATKTCRAAELYQRPLNSMRSLSVLENRHLKVSIFGDKRLVPKKSPDNNNILELHEAHVPRANIM